MKRQWKNRIDSTAVKSYANAHAWLVTNRMYRSVYQTIPQIQEFEVMCFHKHFHQQYFIKRVKQFITN